MTMNEHKRKQEFVSDYPRPPRLERSLRRAQVEFGGKMIADSRDCFRVLETSHPPVFYFPPGDVDQAVLEPSEHTTFCEWKGLAHYWSLRVGEREVADAAWYYPEPVPAFAPIRDYIAFYPGRVDACWLDKERVQAQPGDFYGGWITSEIKGLFKGDADPGNR